MVIIILLVHTKHKINILILNCENVGWQIWSVQDFQVISTIIKVP